ncbi:MAG TPA: hypothetical protein VIC62_00070, partial [Nakamurella sp.]
MTYTLETALADLPAKPRVHELSKRVGTTSKEMLAVLAERGLTIGSASASVPREVAIAVIEHYLGPPDRVEAAALAAEAPPPAAAQAEAVASPDEAPSPPAVPTAASTPVADPLNPLFLPPTEVTTPTGRSTADDESEQDELAPAESAAKRPRRRRGRSSGRRDTGVPVDTDEQVEADGPVVAVEPAVELTEAADEAADESADETAEQDETGGEGAGRRRRRRGRRGRGRVAEGDD